MRNISRVLFGSLLGLLFIVACDAAAGCTAAQKTETKDTVGCLAADIPRITGILEDKSTTGSQKLALLAQLGVDVRTCVQADMAKQTGSGSPL